MIVDVEVAICVVTLHKPDGEIRECVPASHHVFRDGTVIFLIEDGQSKSEGSVIAQYSEASVVEVECGETFWLGRWDNTRAG